MRYSIVVPVYNEAEVLPALYLRLTQVMEGLGEPYEIIFVNDGSHDASPFFIRELQVKDARVKFLSFSRNFGHEIAMTAGLDHSSGQAVVVMDADLQHPPEVIPRLIEKWQEGYDVVSAVREKREEEALLKRIMVMVFYRVFSRLTDTKIPLNATEFRMMSRRAVEAMKAIRERNRFVKGLANWIGFRQTSVSFASADRYAGETKYTFRKLARLALDGITSFSHVPLQLATYFGFAAAFLSFVYMIYAIVIRVMTTRAVPGWASIMVMVLFIGGVQLITLGIIGEYLGRIYEEVKQRPLYIVAEAEGFEEPAKDKGIRSSRLEC
jgi:dolichol-phosphate mannosyltransferase